MKNHFENAMYLYDMKIDERTIIELNNKYALSVIPEYGYHYRDEHDRMHIASRNNPQYIQLNCWVLELGADGLYDMVDFGDICFVTEQEFFNYLTITSKMVKADLENAL